MNDRAPADRLRSGDAWNEFCDAFKSAGRVVLQHRADHVHNLHEVGLEREKIRAELAPRFERFGWDEKGGGKEGGADDGNV